MKRNDYGKFQSTMSIPRCDVALNDFLEIFGPVVLLEEQ